MILGEEDEEEEVANDDDVLTGSGARRGTAADGGEGTVRSRSQSWSLHSLKEEGNKSLTSSLELYQGYFYFDSD